MIDTTIPAAKPRITTDTELYGLVDEKDIERFKEIYNDWPENYRELFEDNNTEFVLGTAKGIGLRRYKPGIVYVAVEPLHDQKYRKAKMEVAKRSDVDVSKISVKDGILKIMFRSLLATIGDGTPELNWEPAISEIKSLEKKDQLLGKKSSIDFSLPDLILMDGYRETGGRPEARKLTEDYLSLVDIKARKAKAEKYAVKYPTTESAFAINYDALTRPQQEYFEKLNEVIKLLGISPKEFDERFRFGAAHLIISTAETVSKAIAEDYNPNSVSKQTILNSINENYCKEGGAYGVPARFVPNRKKVFDKNQEQNLYGIILGSCIDRYIEAYDQLLGVKNIVKPNPATEEQTYAQNFHEVSVGKMLAIRDKDVAFKKPAAKTPFEKPHHERIGKNNSISLETNILSQYTNGAYPMHSLVASQEAFSIPGADIYYPTAGLIFHITLLNTLKSLSKAHPDKELIEGKITELNHIAGWRTAPEGLEAISTHKPLFMKPDELEAYEAAMAKKNIDNDIADKVKKENKESKAAKDTAERQAMLVQKAKIPEEYAINSSVHARIGKTASRNIHPTKTNPEDSALIENMRVLRKQLSPFADKQHLDNKIPQHKALGDALFNDDTLGVLEYAYRPNGSATPPAYDLRAMERAKESIKTIYALNEDAPGLVTEELENNPTLRLEVAKSRLNTNKALRQLLENSPAIVIAAIGRPEDIGQLKGQQETILSPNTSEEDKRSARREMRNAAHNLLKQCGADIELPALNRVTVTTDGRVTVTEDEFSPSAERTLIAFTPQELSTDHFNDRLTEADGQLRILSDTLVDQERLAEAEAAESLRNQLISIFENRIHIRSNFLHRVGQALASREPIDIPLSDAIESPIQVIESPIPEDAKDYKRPITETLRLAENFIYKGMTEEPPHTLFCCHIDPSLQRRHPLIMKMYHYNQNSPDGRLTIDRPPIVTTVQTGDDIEHSLETMRRVQHHVLNMPGVTSYARIDNSRIVIPGEVVLPDQPIINGDGQGELARSHGMLFLKLEYGAPANTEIMLPLHLTQGGQNYDQGRQRAGEVIREIERRHEQNAIVTQRDMDEWVRMNFERQTRTAQDTNTRMDVNFPRNERTTLIGGSLYTEGYPTEMWKFNLNFAHEGQTLRQVSHTFPLHVSDLPTALARRDQIMRTIQFLLENESDRANWDLLTADTLSLRHRTPTDGPPHEYMDESRLDHICNMAVNFEINHRPVIRSRELLSDGSLAITFGLQRTNQRQTIDEWFYEDNDDNDNQRPPAILERTVTFPPSIPEESVPELEQRVQQHVENYLLQHYTAFTRPNENGRQELQTPLGYHPISMINLLETAIHRSVINGENGMFEGATYNFIPPDLRRNGGARNGNITPPNRHAPLSGQETPHESSWRTRSKPDRGGVDDPRII